MGRQIRKWFIRLFAVAMVLFMVVSLGASFFTARNQKEEIQKQQEEAKYKYVDEKTTFKLDGINQTLLIPKGMELDSTTTQEDTGMIVNQYQAVRYEDLGVAIGMVITEMDVEKGANFDGAVLQNIDEAAEQYRTAEYENINYLTFKGETNDYLMVLQTLYEDNSKYSYEVDYTIMDVENQRQYMVSLFLLEPSKPSKTDMLKLDQMAKEIISETKYATAEKVDEFALPEGNESKFNHIIG